MCSCEVCKNSDTLPVPRLSASGPPQRHAPELRPGGVCLSRRIPGAPPKPAPISEQNCLCQAVVNTLSPPPPGVRRPASADGGTAGWKQSSRRSHAVPWGMMTFSTRIFPSSASAVIMVIS